MYQAELYSEHSGMQRKDVKYLLEEYIKLVKWRENPSILDVGCGSADVTTEFLLPKLPEDFQCLIGADLSHEMVSFANVNKRVDERIEYQQLDIDCKEIPKNFIGKFDHIFSFYCLQWIKELRQAMENIYKMLKPGGNILLSFVARHPIFDIYLRLSKKPKWEDYLRDVNLFTGSYRDFVKPEKELERVLNEAGFKTQVCEILERSHTYPNMEVFRKSMIAINPFYSSIPNHLRNEYMDAYDEEVKELNFVKRGSNDETLVAFKYTLFLVYATKEEN